MEWIPDNHEDEPQRPRDPTVDLAKNVLRAHFRDNAENVFYQQQLSVLFEDTFFHWITVSALQELTAEGRLLREEVPLPSGTYLLNVYRVPSHRNWRRQGRRLAEQVAHYSSSDFARAVGRQGELMFDAALPRFGFVPRAKDVREWQGRRWEQTEHDLEYEKPGRMLGAAARNCIVECRSPNLAENVLAEFGAREPNSSGTMRSTSAATRQELVAVTL